MLPMYRILKGVFFTFPFLTQSHNFFKSVYFTNLFYPQLNITVTITSIFFL